MFVLRVRVVPSREAEVVCCCALQAQYKTVTVKRSDLSLENQGSAAAAGGRTPAYGRAPATPMHPGVAIRAAFKPWLIRSMLHFTRPSSQ